ncbi:adenylate/guanylate cyclase domain-containing protein, partial [Cribrihabitans sp. XS_ASV171]
MQPDQQSEGRMAAATVAFADVVGFTALTAEDELGTHKTWSDFQAACLRPAIAEAGGRLVKMLGDGALAVFDEAPAAAKWAMRIQDDLKRDRAADRLRWPRLRLRIGLHQGEVFFDNGDIHGSTVIIARRLQETAAPDSIVLTAATANDLPDALSSRMRDLGYLTLKGDPTPIRAYGINPDGEPVAATRTATQLPTLAVMPFETL